MKRVLVLFAFALVVAGCAGTRFDFDNARKVKVGMTESEVTQIMGKPYSVVSKGDNQIWIWSQANGMTGAHQSISFTMRNGKVDSVPKIPDSFK